MGLDFGNLFGKKDFDDLKVGECMEMSMKVSEDDESTEITGFLACRIDENTVKMKMDIDEEDSMEVFLKKREMRKGDFKKGRWEKAMDEYKKKKRN